MLEFDTAVQAVALKVGASYRRYSDDILILCSPEMADLLQTAVSEALAQHAVTLTLNSEKTEIVHFKALISSPAHWRLVADPKPLQYLGFTFDGERALIRGGTVSRYYRRVAGSIDATKAATVLARKGEIPGRPTPHKRGILAAHSHLGFANVVSSYVATAARVMKELGGQGIRRQFSRHMTVIHRRVNANDFPGKS